MKQHLDMTRIPQHIAIIMDGNGRWAQQNGKERFEGHQEGVVSLHEIVEEAGRLGVRYLTVYVFSTENWSRPQDEVNALMELVWMALYQEIEGLSANNVRLRMIGDLSKLPPASRKAMQEGMERTAHNTGLNFTLALNYSSRWELTEAARQIAREVRAGTISSEQIDEQTVANHLETKDIPDPDLLIRTGGEYRISNYLLWQAAYSELYFTPVYWPEFRKEHFREAIADFQQRERRFGKTGEQIKQK